MIDIKPNRVYFQENVAESIKRIPFLNRFRWDDGAERNGMQCPFFDPDKINKYMGYYWTKDKCLTSSSINELLQEAEKRGDL